MNERWVNPFRKSDDELFDEIAARRWMKVRLRRHAAAAAAAAAQQEAEAAADGADSDVAAENSEKEEEQEVPSDSDAAESDSSDGASVLAARKTAARPKKAARRLAVLDSFLAEAAALPDPVKEEAPISGDKKAILDGFLAAVGLGEQIQEPVVPKAEEKGGWSELPTTGALNHEASSSGLRFQFGNSSSATARGNSAADAAINLIKAGYQNAQQQAKLAKEASAQAAATRSSDAALRTALGKEGGRGRSRSRRRRRSPSGSRDRRKRSRSRRRSRSRKRTSGFDDIDEDKVVESLVSSSDLKAAEQLALSRRMAMGPGGSSGEGQLRPGDWTCPVCSAHNFASKFQCFRCQKAKNPFLDSGPSSGASPAPMMMGSSTQSMKVGDWLCSRCSAHNFASKFQCFRCSQGRNPMLSESAMAGLNLPPQAQIGGRSAAGLALKAAAMAGRQAGGGFNTQAALQAQAAGFALAAHTSTATAASTGGFSRGAPAGFSNGPATSSTGTTLL